MVYILVANTENGEFLALTDRFTRKYLHELRKKKKFFCPLCKELIILRAGEVKTPHFAHLPHSQCAGKDEPESPLHLQGKLQLFYFFQQQNQPAELEKVFPSIKQRADLFVGRQTAIEYQCSPISDKLIQARTEGYRTLGIRPYWIAGTNSLLTEGICLIKLKPFEQAFLQFSLRGDTLILFEPESNVFMYLSNLIYIDGNRWVGKVQHLPAERQRFPFGQPKVCSRKEFEELFSLFFRAKSRFIASKLSGRKKVQDEFWRLCYLLRLSPAQLPLGIGLPMRKADCFRQHAVVWQLIVVHAYTAGKGIDEMLEMKNLKIKEGMDKAGVKFLLKNYLELYESISKTEDKKQVIDRLYANYCKNH